jgi:hypothetical protein
MPNFTIESEVRARFELHDATLVPATLIDARIDDAHTELLRFLDHDFDAGSPDDALIMGETLLAGAHLFRSLAAKQSFEGKRLTVGGQRVEEGERFQALTAIAEAAESQAWYMLEPYLNTVPGRSPADATDTTPVLGEEQP